MRIGSLDPASISHHTVGLTVFASIGLAIGFLPALAHNANIAFVLLAIALPVVVLTLTRRSQDARDAEG